MVWVEDVKNGIYNVIDKNDENNVFYIENMDTKRHTSDSYYKTLAYFYKTKYQNTKFDIIFSSDNNAFDFLKQYRDEIFGNVPVVFGGVNNFEISMLKNTLNYAGIAEEMSFEKNIELILKLHPKTKNIFVINDYLKTGRLIESQMKKVLTKYSNRVNIIYNQNKTILDLRRDVSKLHDDTIILMGVFFSDKDNTNMSYEQVGNYLLDLARVPIYCLVDFNISDNVIGGYVINGFAQGSLMAKSANKILSGIPAKDIRVLLEETNQYIFNAKALKLHNINEENLPYNSKVINRQITYYEQFKDMISINVLIIVFIILVYILFKYKQNIFNEKGILKFLVYAPLVFLPLIIGTLIYNLVEHNQKRFLNEIATLKVEYLQEQQDIAYNEIEKINKYIVSIKKQMTNDLRTELKKRVDDAYTIATNIYEENKNTKSESEIKHIIITALSKIRFFDGRGYYFINTNKAQGVLFNGESKLDSLPDLTKFKDVNGNYVIQNQIAIVNEKNEGFTTHFFNKIGETRSSKKLTFVKKFEPFDWHIGTGEYLDDFNVTIKQEIYRYVSNIRYGKNGYIFAITSKGIVVAHGDSPEIIGKDMSKAVDSNGVQYAKEIIRKALLGSSEFTKFNWYNKQTQQIDTKYGYGRYFENYDLIIGTGVFNNDVRTIIDKETKKLNDKNDEQIKQILSISLIVLIIVLILSYMISNMVKQIFENYNKKLNNLNKSLAKRVDEEIQISKEKDNLINQQAKMASMGEMIGNIAHQWRQPLSVISVGATGLKLQKELDILSDEHLLETCEAINENAQYLSKTIDDFKNFIKNDRDKVKFNLKENIESFLSLVQSSITQHHLNVKLDLDDSIILNSYPNELTQCFMNLFSNAKDALSNNEDTKYLFISTKIDGHDIYISFKDNAGGIDDFVIEKIFEPYFTTKHKSQGTGLGLSMTYKIIVEGMHGSLNVYNREYTYDNKTLKGAEFIIQLHL